MLIRTSGEIAPGLFLGTLGHCCHYCLNDGVSLSIFDPGLSSSIPHLINRFEQFSCSISKAQYIFITHLHADRIGGIPDLRKISPKLKLCASAPMRAKLLSESFLKQLYDCNMQLSQKFTFWRAETALSFDEYKGLFHVDRVIAPSEIVELGPALRLRVVPTPGHFEESVAYFVLPINSLVGDEVFGYFRGSNLATPGGDHDLLQAITSIQKLQDLAVTNLCLPQGGALSGALIRKHLSAVIENSQDLSIQCAKAHNAGMSDQEILLSVRDSLYSTDSTDPVLRYNLEQSLQAVWKQARTWGN